MSITLYAAERVKHAWQASVFEPHGGDFTEENSVDFSNAGWAKIARQLELNDEWPHVETATLKRRVDMFGRYLSGYHRNRVLRVLNYALAHDVRFIVYV